MNTSAHHTSSHYAPSDAMDRHDYGVQKNRKPASTGGGRAWSEDEVNKSHDFVLSDHFVSKSNITKGSLPPPNPATENALQAYRHPSQEN
jgi:hypothetical protein